MLAFSLPDFGTTLLTVFGIGLVIFVHELGHFLCARKVGVRVEIFSLGFGPRLFGIQRNGTDYRVALVPVGGYVKMAGDQPGEGTGAPDELMSRTVGERALIYSGGVIMNMLFALVAFPVLFAVGVPILAPEVGRVTPGGPAWKAGLEPNDRILAVNGREILGFSDVALEIAVSDPRATRVRVQRGDDVLELPVAPRYDERIGANAIGIEQPELDVIAVAADGPAWRAGLRDGDRLLAVDGVPFESMDSQFLDKDAVRLSVEHADGARAEVELPLTKSPVADQWIIGVRAFENVVLGTRGGFAAAGAPFAAGDVLLALDGVPIRERADVAAAVAAAAGAPLEATYERGEREQRATLAPELAARLPADVALGQNRDGGSLGLPVRIARGSPAERAGLADGMRVLAVDAAPIASWDDLRAAVAAAGANEIAVRVRAEGAERTFRIAPEQATMVDDPGFGFPVKYDTRRYSPGHAFKVGMQASWNLARQTWLTLRKMVSREISATNLGGIVAISKGSYEFARRGVATLFYFLALLSINLAVMNVLPIPLLDGGHLLFLLIEKIKGSPVNDRVMGYSQVLGLVVILSLLIFVTYNDINKLLGRG